MGLGLSYGFSVGNAGGEGTLYPLYMPALTLNPTSYSLIP